MRSPLGQIQSGETLEGADEGSRVVSQGQGEVVGLALDPARETVGERHLECAQQHEHQGQPGQAGRIGRPPQAPPMHAGLKQRSGQREADEREESLHDQPSAHVTVHVVTELVAGKRLVRVLDRYCPHIPGYFLYYPSRVNVAPKLKVLIDFLRRSDSARRSGR